jgi:rfaE bifunctional protein kinase chain/domain
LDTKKIKTAFQKFEDLKILIIGDVMIDSYIWGTVERISPEAPVPVVSIHNQERRLGGAANVALNIKAMGATPILCSVIGDDDRKEGFIDLLTEENLSDVGILIDQSRITTVKTRIISDRQHLIRVDEEIDFPLSPGSEQMFDQQISELLTTGKVDAIIFQDYDKGIVTSTLIRSVVNTAKQAGIPVLADPKFRNFLEYENVNLFKPNFREFIRGLNVNCAKSDYVRIYDIARTYLHEQLSIGIVMLTLSELGVFISTTGGYYHIPAEIRDVADVSGAGDTVISLAALCLATGLDIEYIAAISNLAGGLVCEKVGVVPADKQELLDECIQVLGK